MTCHAELKPHTIATNLVAGTSYGRGGCLPPAGMDGSGMIAWLRRPSTTVHGKNHSCRWVLDAYLKSCKYRKTDLAYLLDAYSLHKPCTLTGGGSPSISTLANHDVYFLKRAFSFDLNPMPHEVPTDVNRRSTPMFFELIRRAGFEQKPES